MTHCTEHIKHYLNYTKDDVIGKDIYNIIHHGDHNTFMPPMSSPTLGVYRNCAIANAIA